MTLLSATGRALALGTALLLAPTVHAAPSPATAGGERVCAYTSGLSSWSYASARVTYPCTLSKAAYPATTLTGGFSNTKEQMTWLSEHLSSHGYIVITLTPNNVLGSPPGWQTAHKAGIATLKQERARSGSPLYNKIDLSKLGLTGFSMGGGGALLAAADLKAEIKAAVPMAPYLGFSSPNYGAISAKVLIQAGASDTVAYPSTVASYYQSLPTGISRALTTFRGATHLDFINSGNTTRQARFKTLVTAWLKVYLDGDSEYATYLDGAEHNRHLAEDWFTRFEYVR
ncbi:MAG: dienelactone hydrolase family protein [Pseudomonadota bacterium]